MRSELPLERPRVAYLDAPEHGLPVHGGLEVAAEWTALRESICKLSSAYGTTGPLAEYSARQSQGGVPDDPDFYVVDDRYNDDKRLCVEPKIEMLSARWLRDVSKTLRNFPGWDVLVAAGGNVTLLVDPDRVRITGWHSTVKDLGGVVAELRAFLEELATGRSQYLRMREMTLREPLQQVWKSLEQTTLALVASFDDHADGTKGGTVWLLHPRDRSKLDLSKYRFEPPALCPVVLWCDAKGRCAAYDAREGLGSGETALLVEWAFTSTDEAARGRRVHVVRGSDSWDFLLGSSPRF